MQSKFCRDIQQSNDENKKFLGWVLSLEHKKDVLKIWGTEFKNFFIRNQCQKFGFKFQGGDDGLAWALFTAATGMPPPKTLNTSDMLFEAAQTYERKIPEGYITLDANMRIALASPTEQLVHFWRQAYTYASTAASCLQISLDIKLNKDSFLFSTAAAATEKKGKKNSSKADDVKFPLPLADRSILNVHPPLDPSALLPTTGSFFKANQALIERIYGEKFIQELGTQGITHIELLPIPFWHQGLMQVTEQVDVATAAKIMSFCCDPEPFTSKKPCEIPWEGGVPAAYPAGVDIANFNQRLMAKINQHTLTSVALSGDNTIVAWSRLNLKRVEAYIAASDYTTGTQGATITARECGAGPFIALDNISLRPAAMPPHFESCADVRDLDFFEVENYGAKHIFALQKTHVADDVNVLKTHLVRIRSRSSGPVLLLMHRDGQIATYDLMTGITVTMAVDMDSDAAVVVIGPDAGCGVNHMTTVGDVEPNAKLFMDAARSQSVQTSGKAPPADSFWKLAVPHVPAYMLRQLQQSAAALDEYSAGTFGSKIVANFPDIQETINDIGNHFQRLVYGRHNPNAPFPWTSGISNHVGSLSHGAHASAFCKHLIAVSGGCCTRYLSAISNLLLELMGIYASIVRVHLACRTAAGMGHRVLDLTQEDVDYRLKHDHVMVDIATATGWDKKKMQHVAVSLAVAEIHNGVVYVLVLNTDGTVLLLNGFPVILFGGKKGAGYTSLVQVVPSHEMTYIVINTRDIRGLAISYVEVLSVLKEFGVEHPAVLTDVQVREFELYCGFFRGPHGGGRDGSATATKAKSNYQEVLTEIRKSHILQLFGGSSISNNAGGYKTAVVPEGVPGILCYTFNQKELKATFQEFIGSPEEQQNALNAFLELYTRGALKPAPLTDYHKAGSSEVFYYDYTAEQVVTAFGCIENLEEMLHLLDYRRMQNTRNLLLKTLDDEVYTLYDLFKEVYENFILALRRQLHLGAPRLGDDWMAHYCKKYDY